MTIYIVALVSVVIGFLLAFIFYNQKTANAKSTLLNLQQEAQRLDVLNQDYYANIQTLNSRISQQETIENHQKTQISILEIKEKHLVDELLECKENLGKITLKLEEKTEQCHSVEKQKETLDTENLMRKEQLSETKQNLMDVQEKNYQLQQEFQTLNNDYTELKTSLKRREEAFKEQLQQLNENKVSLMKEFENLANKIFEEKGKTFTQTSQASIDGLLKPFKFQIETFQNRINEVHDASLKGNTNLTAEIKKILDVGLQMSKEANNLTSALKGNSQQRGAWGEAQLRRTLEMSGLVENAHFEIQSAFKDAEGKQKQTDYLIKLPDNKHLVIDSKVTLNAYDRMVAAQTQEEYEQALAEHVKAVKKHIDDLSSKDYTNLIGVYSPNFVLMFMPIEPAYTEALKFSKDLFEYGYNKGIILVSHTTLIPILRTISNLWMIARSNMEAREISEKAGDIYNQVCLIAENLSKLGGTLNTVSNHYNSTVRALAGKQGLYGKVDRFNQLSIKTNKKLPALEASNIDFETERLDLIVEPINEAENI